jgi:hypothetical protein
MGLGEIEWGVWTRLVWLRIGTSGELLWMWHWTFRFHWMRGNYWVATQLVACGVMRPFGMLATTGLVPAPVDWWWWVWSSQWNDWWRKLKYSEKTCSSATLSTTNPISPNQGRSCRKPATFCPRLYLVLIR